ncbi:MAG: hypothetical protein IJU95_02220 [Treponema sp.]|nr:hypothetical protein [Treponema sp.]
MAEPEVTSNIFTLLKGFSSKQRSAVIDFSEFADYVRSYAQHHINENAGLQAYLGSTDEALEGELKKLSSSRQIVITSKSQGTQTIFVISSFIEQYADRYKDIDVNISIPFPNINDIPKNVPNNIVTKTQGGEQMMTFLDGKDSGEKTLYALDFGKGIPDLLFPSSVPVNMLIKLALKKLQDLLRKEESHDYFLKKLTNANPGKELTIKNFFQHFVARPEDAMDALKLNGDNFYSWSQMCYFIRQDYNKLKDLTTEDINILQSIFIIETTAAYYKAKTAEKTAKEAAFKEFDQRLASPPYYFNKDDIDNMKDSRGKLLLGQYTKEELNDHIKELHSPGSGNSLPALLLFKLDDGSGFFILKEKVMAVVLRLCNDARALIRDGLSKEWYLALKRFETLPEMKEQLAFEGCLERELAVADPILYAILHAHFLPVVAFEDSTPGRITLYRNGELVSYSELLLISRAEIYSNAKMKLPFYYTIPGLSWLISLFRNAKNKKNKKKKGYETVAEKILTEDKEKSEAKLHNLNANDKGGMLSRTKAIRNEAAGVESEIVPENSTLDRELEGYLSEWNDRLDKQAYENLREDINSLIRDYVRKTLRTFKNDNVSLERIQSLAKSLEETPSLMKIKNHPSLRRYIELYIIKLLKNLPSS